MAFFERAIVTAAAADFQCLRRCRHFAKYYFAITDSYNPQLICFRYCAGERGSRIRHRCVICASRRHDKLRVGSLPAEEPRMQSLATPSARVVSLARAAEDVLS